MYLNPILKMGGIAVLTVGLTACMDVSMDLEVLSETDARATMKTSMAADIYAMISAQADGEDDFCEDGETVETATTVDCIVVKEGTFAEIMEDDDGPTLEAIGNGQVRVSFPTGELSDQVSEGLGGDDDPEMMAMIASMFEGNAISMTISGGQIVDTNMEVAEDGMSARYDIPFVGIITGDLDLPEELYAIVQK
ncbi:hypothetical protein [Pelagibacterium lentulum]|uniref:Uncharacterized protein n=1 Tax=Pelagibacterium lentulum TaxID=2029865 RepID=A0A916VUQ1_9HYPH|nr:hypothetical protein [Pelagibacterium lentulum]GGA38027.1 hypothetical protein GCM10011499_04260 [Pelagibacterium lentulum]